ncbi:type II toxin-antitoxin system RatA family toxin [Pokkaliibacter sp. MBI-7]|uniref:Ubiquinone-binding protein n=1 Tax=Proteobacteria bacterium 228 TaxID=2083153 RepID=A0A2S5KHZ3_9PROT|nr:MULTISPECIES: type II toxin-antitoxin system RatA family toxin [Pokkaliibacter]MDH2432212.1 type II toxin-antitoxin system RatA family toxin [Pokkaliibacter sp. MBI-7]PPC74408.1 ubiquinone-binding protein [Pokkaliibacter plantistimulans]
MTTVDRSALVMHSAASMFDIVNDVAAYPQFLPWCSATRIISVTDEEMVASVDVSKGGLKYTFTTRNRLQRPAFIQLELVEGPFRQLTGKWDFKELNEQACKVSLSLSFDFANKLAGMAMGKVFNQIATTMVEAFCKRAEVLYGKA